jgi:hypothetical protein
MDGITGGSCCTFRFKAFKASINAAGVTVPRARGGAPGHVVVLVWFGGVTYPLESGIL